MMRSCKALLCSSCKNGVQNRSARQAPLTSIVLFSELLPCRVGMRDGEGDGRQ